MISHSFQDLLNDIRSRLDRIELNRDLFKVSTHYDSKEEHGMIEIYYGRLLIVRFNYLRSNFREDDKVVLRGSCTIKRYRYPKWFDEYKNHKSRLDVHVNEYYDARVSGNELHDLTYYLDEYIPIGVEEARGKVDACLRKHNLAGNQVSFNTMTGKYAIEMDLESYLNFPKSEEKDKLFLYKYTSLESYRNMLNHGTFRINSVVAMNDVSETLWADFMMGEGDIDDETYYESVVGNRNKLVTSFTSMRDDATMWRLYGHKGNGVCLIFEVPTQDVTKVLYVSESDANMQVLKEVRHELADNDIHIEFRGLDKMKLYIKSSSYRVEGEYRYVYDAKEDMLEIADYGSLLSPYKDFRYNAELKGFDGLPFRFVGVIFGRSIPNFKTVFPLLVAETDRRFPNVDILTSNKWELR